MPQRNHDFKNINSYDFTRESRKNAIDSTHEMSWINERIASSDGRVRVEIKEAKSNLLAIGNASIVLVRCHFQISKKRIKTQNNYKKNSTLRKRRTCAGAVPGKVEWSVMMMIWLVVVVMMTWVIDSGCLWDGIVL